MATSYKVSLDDDVRAVLERADVTDASVVINEQLDRKLYERVNKVLVAAGGTWDRQTKAHYFPGGRAKERLGLAMQNGEITDERKVRQQFWTPAFLAKRMCDLACVDKGARVLEPSAGSGVLATEAWLRGAHVDCFENDPALCDNLANASFTVWCRDFLTVTPAPNYDAVIMNPPFSNKQDIAHVRHAMKFLKSGGVLVAIVSRSAKDTLQCDAEWIGSEDVPDGAFKEAGTDVRTSLMLFGRRS